jgi:hypothetical protein
MLHLKAFRKHTDRRLLPRYHTFDCQQRLMLMRFNSRFPRRLLAEIQESANLIAEIRERTVVDRLFLILSHRHSIISYYDILTNDDFQFSVEFRLNLKEN